MFDTDYLSKLSQEQIRKDNLEDSAQAMHEYQEFVSYYQRGECFICKKPLQTNSSEVICLHSLLRQNWAKKKDFQKLFFKYWYFNIATYVRWAANQDSFIRNINNLEDEKSSNKKFEYTVKCGHIERTFSCANSDFSGHCWACSFPHYHFQMRISNKPFIDFSDFHIRFSEYDLRMFKAIESGHVKFNWSIGGAGIQEAMDTLESNPDVWIDAMRVGSENEAQFNVQSIITGPGWWRISGDEISKIIEESQRSWKIMTAVARERFWSENVKIFVSPAESLPDIAARKPIWSKKTK